MTKKFILSEWWGSLSTKRVGEIKDTSMVVKPCLELIDLFQSFENRIESLEQVDKILETRQESLQETEENKEEKNE